MRNTNRLIALALCFTLTLGAFVYRPPEAKALVGVDDAVVIGALLSAFAGGCGLIFSNNGMSSNEIAQGLTAKWNDFKETLASVPADFPAWLGYDSMDALITDLRWDEVKDVLSVPRAIARKLADFTEWLVDSVGVVSGSNKSVFSSSNLTFDGKPIEIGQLSFIRSTSNYSFSGLSGNVVPGSNYTLLVPPDDDNFSTIRLGRYHARLAKDWVASKGLLSCSVDGGLTFSDWVYTGDFKPQHFLAYDGAGVLSFVSSSRQGSDATFYVHPFSEIFRSWFYKFGFTVDVSDFAYLNTSFSVGTTVNAGDFSHLSGKFGDAAKDDTAPPPSLSNVGDGTATTVEELLQQILAQLQANTLSPSLDVDGTQTGGETGTDTDEDAKPYLPFIPQIFDKVKEIPGTLSNIWDTVKQLPAAIAEKISAFFTTLWGWLQDIITEIKALPAAIAEKVGALFTPDEALVTEITDTFKGKFGFLSTLKQFANDLFGMTADSEPPVIWVHLENAESKFGYNYGGKEVALDLSWYQKYKPTVDGIVSGFLWIGYLWMLFTKAPDILNGMGLRNEAVPPMPNLEYINPLRLNGRTSKKRRD